MPHPILLTAFASYGPYAANASAECLAELLARGLPAEIRGELWPVDFERVADLTAAAWETGLTAAIHLGQAPGSERVRLETRAVNRRIDPYAPTAGHGRLDPLAPELFDSGFPLAAWAEELRTAGHDATLSDDAGTYLCNAALFRSLQAARRLHGHARAVFVHLPLTEVLPPARAAACVAAVIERVFRACAR